ISEDPEPLSALWRAKQLEYTWLHTLMGRYEDFWAITEAALTYACRRLGLTVGAAERGRLMQAYLALEPFPEVRAVLERLQGLPCAILSNGAPRMLEAAVAHAGLGSHFKAVSRGRAARLHQPGPQVDALCRCRPAAPHGGPGFDASR